MDGLDDILAASSHDELEMLMVVTMGSAMNPGLSPHEREIADDGVRRIAAELTKRERGSAALAAPDGEGT